MRIKYLGLDKTGPEGMGENPYAEGSKLWNLVVDFACMPTNEFSLSDCAKYHGIELEYYTKSELDQLESDKIIKKEL